MQGYARAAKRRHDEQTALAWLTANFSAAAQCGKLKALSNYVTVAKPKRQSTDEMLATLRSFSDRAKLNIRKLN